MKTLVWVLLPVLLKSCATSVSVQPGETQTLVFVTAVVSSLYSADPTTDALSDLAAALRLRPGALLREHTSAWEARHARDADAAAGDPRSPNFHKGEMRFANS